MQLPRQFENECQKIRQEQFFMTLRGVNLGVFSASTCIFMNCGPLSSMAKAHRCNILADCHIGGTDEQTLLFRFFFLSARKRENKPFVSTLFLIIFITLVGNHLKKSLGLRPVRLYGFTARQVHSKAKCFAGLVVQS